MKRYVMLLLAGVIGLSLFGCKQAGSHSAADSAQQNGRETVYEATVPLLRPTGTQATNYMETYHADKDYTDLFVPQKHWLINDTSLIQLVLMPGTTQAKEIPFTAIDRVETTEIGEYSVLTVYDKTNTSLTLNQSPAVVQEITQHLPK